MDTNLIRFLFFLIILFVIYLYVKYEQKKDQRKREEHQKERDEIQREKDEIQIAKRSELYSSIFEIIETDFIWDVCSKCNDQSLSFLKFNSVGTSVYVECETCEKKTWYKAKEGFEKGQEIIEIWEEIKELGELISVDWNEVYLMKGQEDELYKEDRKPIPQSVKDKVWNRDDGRCVECGSNEKLEYDHIIPFSKGGSNTYRNLQLLCENCNRKKSNNIG